MKFAIVIATTALAFMAVGCTNAENKSAPHPASVAPSVPLQGPAPVVAAAPAKAQAMNKKVCTKGTEKREFEVQSKGTGCILNSLEAGKMKEEVVGTTGNHRCEKKEKLMVAKLTQDGFQCQ